MAERPKITSGRVEQELDKVAAQFDKFDEQVKSLSQDEMNKAPIVEQEQQTKMSNREMNKADGLYLKPERSLGDRAAFNEKFRDQWNKAKEYVKCTVENFEIIGESVEVWTKPFAGVPAEFWRVPVNKVVWIPRHLADQLATRIYHRLVMEESKHVSSDGAGTYYGAMAAKETRRRIDCRPVMNGFMSMSGV
jgi:hypothetical protein